MYQDTARGKSLRKKIITVMLIMFITINTGFISILNMISAKAMEEEPFQMPSYLDENTVKSKGHKKLLKEYSTENTSVFENEDGTKTAYLFKDPIRYRDSNGQLQDIDNNIEETDQAKKEEGLIYKNKANDYKVLFPNDVVSKKYIVIDKDNFKIKFKPLVDVTDDLKMKYNEFTSNVVKEASEKARGNIVPPKYRANLKSNLQKTNKKDTVLYNSIFDDNIDLKYTMQLNGLKEDIVINKYTGINTFKFEYIIPGLYMNVRKDNSIELKDKETNELIYTIPAFFAYDSYPGDYNDGVQHYTEDLVVSTQPVEGKDDTYILTVSLNKDYLTNPKIVYPVTIDPAATAVIDRYKMDDTSVLSNDPYGTYTATESNRVGYTTGNGICRAYIKYTGTLPNINGGVISSAYYKAQETTGGTAAAEIGIYRVNSDWSASSLNWNSAQSLQCGSRETYLSVNKAGTYNFDITNIVKTWYSTGGTQLQGFMMKSSDESNMSYYKKFGSSYSIYYPPYIQINYNDDDVTPPSDVSGVSYQFIKSSTDGKCNVKTTWAASTDNKGIDHYIVQLKSGSTVVQQSGNIPASSREYTFNDLSANIDQYTLVYYAYDTSNIRSRVGTERVINTPDYTAPIPNYLSFTTSSSTWTSSNYYTINWCSDTFTDKSGLNTCTPIMYDINGSNNWVSTNVDLPNNKVNINLTKTSTNNYVDGIYNIRLKVMDKNSNSKIFNNYGNPTKTFTYKKDTSISSCVINSPLENAGVNGLVRININAQDFSADGVSNFYSWQLDYREKGTSGSYILIQKGYSSVNNIDASTWDVNSLTMNKQYELRLTVTDKASPANTKSVIRNVTKTNATFSQPELKITEPTSNEIITTSTENVITTKQTNFSGNFVNSYLYIDGKKSGYSPNTNNTNGLMIDSLSLSEGYHDIFIAAQDPLNSNKYVYSTTRYVDNFGDTFDDGNDIYSQNKTLRNSTNQWIELQKNGSVYYSTGDIISKEVVCNGYVNKYKLTVSQTLPTGTSILYYIAVYDNYNNGNVTWKPITLNQDTLIVDPTIVGHNFRIKAVLNTTNNSTPTLNDWNLESTAVLPVEADNFAIKLISPPNNISAMSKVNNSIYLRWENPVSNGSVKYNVYRGETIDFVPSLSNQIASDLTDAYYSDFDLKSSTIYYYKITATKIFGTLRESVPINIIEKNSNVATAKSIDENELKKFLGLEDYWSFTPYKTSEGIGYVNVTTGNLAYQTTDFVNQGTLLATVMRRTYNSQSTSVSALGYGWDFSFNTTLLNSYDSNGNINGVILKDGDGSTHFFEKAVGTDSYVAPKGVFMTISITRNNSAAKYEDRETWTIKRNDNISYKYNTRRQLIEFTDSNGSCISYAYDARGNISTITDNVSNIVNISYAYNPEEDNNDPEGIYNNTYSQLDLIQKITDNSGRVFDYDYVKDAASGNIRLGRVRLDKGQGIYTSILYSYDDSDVNPKFTVRRTANNSVVFNLERNSDDTLKDNRVLSVNLPENQKFTFNYQEGSTIISRLDTTNSGAPESNNKRFIFYWNVDGTLSSTVDQENRTKSIIYNDNKKVTNIQYQQNANITINLSYTYDANGNILTAVDADGNTTTYSGYNSFNKPAKAVTVAADNPSVSRTTEFTYYPTTGNLWTTKDPLGKITTYTYYPNGLPYTVTDCYGKVITYQYDSKGRLTSSKTSSNIDASFSQTTTVNSYDAQGNPTSITDGIGNETVITYDMLGRKTFTQYPDGQSEEWEYDDNNNISKNLKKWTSSSTYIITSYTYDNQDRLTEVQYPDGSYDYTTYSYNTSNNLVVRSGRNGLQLNESVYNDQKLVETVTAGGGTTSYEYDYLGNPIKITSSEGIISEAVYDKLNRTTKTILHNKTNPTNSSLDIVQTATYAELGSKVTKRDGDNYVTKYEYDSGNRLTKVSQGYVFNNNQIELIAGAQGYDTIYTYDQQVIDNGKTYIKNTNTDAEGRIKETLLDSFGRTYKDINRGNSSNTDIKTTEYRYNSKGQLEQTINPDGTTVTNEYDNIGRILTVSADTNNYITYEYHLDTNTINTTTNTLIPGTQAQIVSSTEKTCDILDRVTSYNQNGNSVIYDYDTYGNISNVRYSSTVSNGVNKDRTLHYTYDNRYGRLQTISLDGNIARGYIYNETNGLLESIRNYYELGSTAKYIQEDLINNDYGSICEIGYYKNSTGIKDSDFTGAIKNNSLLEKYTMTYNNRGMITTETSVQKYTQPETNKTITNEYDFIGRLKNVTTTENSVSKVESYTFDKVGNRLTVSKDGKIYDYIYDTKGFNQLTKIKRDNVDYNEYEYDSMGRQKTAKTNLSDSHYKLDTYEYNAFGELYKQEKREVNGIRNDLISKTENFYNSEGQRTRKTVYGANDSTGVANDYYYTGGAILFTTSDYNGGARTTENIVTPWGEIVASKRFEGLYTDKFYFYNYDPRGSVTGIFGPDGNSVVDYAYDSFGNKTKETNSQFKNEVKFTGAISDDSTGLYYMNARFYNPESGRFLTQDTYNGSATEPWTQHLYSYCGNNPVNYTDPTGHYTQEEKDYYEKEMHAEMDANPDAFIIPGGPNSHQTQIYRKEYLDYIQEKGEKEGKVEEEIKQYKKDYKKNMIEEARIKEIENRPETKAVETIITVLNIVALFTPVGAAERAVAVGEKVTEVAVEVLEVDSLAAAEGESVMGKVIDAIEESELKGGLCFTGDTLIPTKDGNKQIKDIEIGDEVYSANPETGEKGLKKVKNVYVHETDTLIHVFVGKEEIRTTFTHPFWVEGKGWVVAGELQAGDKLRLFNGKTLEISKTVIEKLEETIKVYNFEVEDWHTYFVSDTEVLVHNTCKTPLDSPKSFNRLKKGQGFADENGAIWKKDMLHKDHFDIMDSKGNKIKEVDFDGNELWPNGPKNKNKKPW